MFKQSVMAGFFGLALGDQHSVILRPDGSVWSTAITSGGLRLARDEVSKHFGQVIPSGATAADASIGFSLVLKQDSSVWVMGRNYHGQLGDGTKVRKGSFVPVDVIPGAKAVAAGGYHSMVLTQGGCVWTTGWNEYGQLGYGSQPYSTRFRRAIYSGVKAIAAGDLHSMALMRVGSVWAVGRNDNGQLGDGSKADKSSFVKVMTNGSVAVAVAAGGYHSMVLKLDGSVWATGWNQYGQLGDGFTADRIKYVQIVSSGVHAVAAGRRHSMMLKQDGSVWSTGYNEHGQLGNGRTTNSKVFVQVISDGTRIIAAGAFHSMVVKEDGSVWGTGSNKDGQFGDDSTASQNHFIRLAAFGKGVRHDTIICTWIHLLDLPPSYLSACLFSFYLCDPLPFDNHNTPNSWLYDYDKDVRHDCDYDGNSVDERRCVFTRRMNALFVTLS